MCNRMVIQVMSYSRFNIIMIISVMLIVEFHIHKEVILYFDLSSLYKESVTKIHTESHSIGVHDTHLR